MTTYDEIGPKTPAAAGRRLPASPSLFRRVASVFAPAVKRGPPTIGESEAIADPIWDGEAQAALKAAFSDARVEGRPIATCNDVVGALLRLGSLDALRAELGLNFDVEENPTEEPWAGTVDAAPALSLAIVRSRRRTPVGKRTALDLFAACFECDPRLREELKNVGVIPSVLARYAAHGVTAHPRYSEGTAPQGEELAMVLHNDDYTTQDYVVHMLRERGFDDEEAKKVCSRCTRKARQFSPR